MVSRLTACYSSLLSSVAGLATSARKECEARRNEVVTCVKEALRMCSFHLFTYISRLIVRYLGVTSGILNPVMNYKNYQSGVVERYGVRLVGYPLQQLKNPSEMRRDELLLVHDGFTADPPTIYFEKLTPEELRAVRRKAREAQKAAAASVTNPATKRKANDDTGDASSKRPRVTTPSPTDTSLSTESSSSSPATPLPENEDNTASISSKGTRVMSEFGPEALAWLDHVTSPEAISDTSRTA